MTVSFTGLLAGAVLGMVVLLLSVAFFPDLGARSKIAFNNLLIRFHIWRIRRGWGDRDYLENEVEYLKGWNERIRSSES